MNTTSDPNRNPRNDVKPDVVFVQLTDKGVRTDRGWAMLYRGELIARQPVVERVTGEVIRPPRRLVRIEEGIDGYYRWTTHGHSLRPGGGTRHHRTASLSEAQDAILRWAERRFRASEPERKTGLTTSGDLTDSNTTSDPNRNPRNAAVSNYKVSVEATEDDVFLGDLEPFVEVVYVAADDEQSAVERAFDEVRRMHGGRELELVAIGVSTSR